ncbi:hypothetical protein PV08_07637 [Exophiala spinifera]|uniref:Zn(2)-C6 fungal-type domain-containing protein n=1 Tax=Exophiala spinifera TaxID=91928 RepID=A0A0D1ZPV7_9EURO|nr:uncharacterized protein PV08_07637 [Exophiala spinifera]KIW14852.1 hypothetical protein PV08_07637 [Exophiala spinifera]
MNTPSTTMRACEACNAKKTKCDMVRPTCGLCQRTGRSCIFPTSRKPPRPSLKRTSSESSNTFSGNLNLLLSILGKPDAINLAANQARMLTTAQSATTQNHVTAAQGQDDVFESDLSVTTPSTSLHKTSAPSPSQTGAVGQRFPSQASSFDAVPDTIEPISEHAPQPSPTHPIQQPTVFVSYDVALDLIETFFSHIQPWLPLLHKPRFAARIQQQLEPGADALRNVSLEVRLLMMSMFGLAARFSNHFTFQGCSPLDRASIYMPAARQAYLDLRNQNNSSLLYLQGSILLAVFTYTDEMNTQAWILTGVCVRLAYEIDLYDIDGDFRNSPHHRDGMDHVEFEEMRRAWWLTWELDTFGSLVMQKPFAVDRHQFNVRLPLSDEDWFAERDVESQRLLTAPEESWKSLQGSRNQNPRAWFLIVNHLLSLVAQHLSKPHLSSESNIQLVSACNCLRLAWPSSFHILTSPPLFNQKSFPESNWIIGSHLMLTTTYTILFSVQPEPYPTLSPASGISQSSETKLSARVVYLPQIVALWPPEYISLAHPFFVCCIMPTRSEIGTQRLDGKSRVALDAVENSMELVISHFAQKWKLATDALTIFRFLRGATLDPAADQPLRRRFAAFFTRKTSSDNPRRNSTSQNGNDVSPGPVSQIGSESSLLPDPSNQIAISGASPGLTDFDAAHNQHRIARNQSGHDGSFFWMGQMSLRDDLYIDSAIGNQALYPYSPIFAHPLDNSSMFDYGPS